MSLTIPQAHELYAISLWQPWGWAIVEALKDIENRPWKLPARHVGSIVLIHAAKRMDDPDAWDAIQEVSGYRPPPPYEIARGALIGVAWFTGSVVEGHPLSRSPWFSGPHGFTIGGAAPFDWPVPCRGQQKFWKPKEMRDVRLLWPPSLMKPGRGRPMPIEVVS